MVCMYDQGANEKDSLSALPAVVILIYSMDAVPQKMHLYPCWHQKLKILQIDFDRCQNEIKFGFRCNYWE